MGKLVKQLQLAEQTAAHLRAGILKSAEVGLKLPAVRQLAEQLGVSVTTVRAAQTLLAQEGWLTIRHGSGVYVAERRQSWRVGILSELDLLHMGHSLRAVAQSLKNKLETLGAVPRLYVGNSVPGDGQAGDVTCPQFWDDVAAGRLDGAVILDVPSTMKWFMRIHACPIPAVGDMTDYYVEFDSAGVANAAVRHLAERGCRRVGLLSWNKSEPFRLALGQLGLAINENWIRSNIDPSLRGAGWEEFREIWGTAGEKPDGLVILDDVLFADAQLAMIEMGVRIPEDLQLAVQTNRKIPFPLRMPITAFEVDPAEKAEAYVDLLMKRLRGEPITNKKPILSFRKLEVQMEATARPLPQRRQTEEYA